MVEGLSEGISELEHRWCEAPASRWFIPLAEALLQADRPEEAAEVCRRGLAETPDAVAGFLLLGEAADRLGRIDESRRAYREALRGDARNGRALRALGDLAMESGDRAGALRWYRRLRQARPELGWADQQREELERGVELAPDAPLISPTIAELYIEQGLYEEALMVLKRLATQEPLPEDLKARIEAVEARLSEERTVRPA